ncbi:hypothetical protein FX988_00103 [Paraglaciecola mesophila]|uniref:Uncharacterized protein n=1 Tax=Paraglaciecola mesophila TaxID=197222 RepID=A0A857JCZ2_9ALTE|nr:hypothetical protein FX988_00103 [Paraglaciecola mesophila]
MKKLDEASDPELNTKYKRTSESRCSHSGYIGNQR